MSTFTTTSSFTITHARYVTAKVAADLRQLRGLYGRGPTDEMIADYAEEAALLLRDGYLERVDYGFKRDTPSGSQWVLLLRYVARSGQLTDDHSGRVPARAPIDEAYFHSYLTYTGRYLNLSPSEKERVKESLPVKRTSGDDAGFAAGTWSGDRGYSSNNQGVARSVFQAL